MDPCSAKELNRPWISIKGGEDYIIGKLCTEQCVGYLVECVAECNNDPVCISMCAREESKCVDSCPCHTDCMEGCFGCEHPLCNQVSPFCVGYYSGHKCTVVKNGSS